MYFQGVFHTLPKSGRPVVLSQQVKVVVRGKGEEEEEEEEIGRGDGELSEQLPRSLPPSLARKQEKVPFSWMTASKQARWARLASYSPS